MSEVPNVLVLESIRPQNAGTGAQTLAYGGLLAAVCEYGATNRARQAEFWAAPEGTLEEQGCAADLAKEYLVDTAERAVYAEPEHRALWAKRFTDASIELYGEPDRDEAARLLLGEYRLLKQLEGSDRIAQGRVRFLLDTYRPIIESLGGSAEDIGTSDLLAERQAIREYGQAVREKYQPIFDLVNRAGKEEFGPDDMLGVFSDALEWLRTNEGSEWDDWEVALHNKTAMSVVPSKKLIKIAAQRRPATAGEVVGLLGHELLTHGLRSKNGYAQDDRRLAIGLSGYIDSEEGLGILTEEALLGTLPDKAYDRYLDIALALGTIDGRRRTRQELFDISYTRQLIRNRLRGDLTMTAGELVPVVWAHVDRIYRGGRGDGDAEEQAIFTRDISYYVGYKRMAAYLAEQRAAGKTAAEIFEYLSRGKFDPTNPQHVEYVDSIYAARQD
ncbi:MAG TPA: hypothetical protein VGS28_02090 [Candidatus Saccharimonadales bacterium]|nr:hypothetical protein [Candidatus Saccharimonadales bacterium]